MRGKMQHLLYRLHVKSLHSYITVIMTGSILLALIVSGTLFYSRTFHTLKSVYQEQMVQQLNTTMQQVTEQVNLIDSLYMMFTSNNMIYDSLDNDNSEKVNTISVERQMTYLLITNYVWKEQFIDSVSIYANNGISYHVSTDESDTKKRQNKLIMERSNLKYPYLQIIIPEENSNELYFIRNVFSFNNGQRIATMVIAIDQKKWMNYLGSSLDNGWLIKLYSDNFELYSLSEHSSSLDLDEYLTVSQHLYNLDIYAMVMAPRSELYAKSNDSLRTYFVIMILIILMVILAAYALSRAATYPIMRMIQHINRISEGHYEETLPADRMYEEFNSLAAAFNHLLEEINAYHVDNLEKQLLLKNAEIQALQSQINPHFLFNTLNTLAWKAQMSDNPELYQMTISLGELLKSNILSRSASYFSLQDELKYIKFYIYLQKMRFEDKINVILDIHPGLEELKIPCFCIQSLVENAFVHGLEPKKGNGELLISIQKADNHVEIAVKDDGVGFQNLPDLQTIEASEEDSHTHIGLKNLDRRLYLLYGETSRLRIKSVPNELTIVSFNIPLGKETHIL